jgi:CRISPR-associated protein Csh1
VFAEIVLLTFLQVYFAEHYLTARWGGSSLFLLPSQFDNTIESMFTTKITTSKDPDTLLRTIYERETYIFDLLGNMQCDFDLLFFNKNKSEWKIQTEIQSVNATRFKQLADIKNTQRIDIENKDGTLQLKTVVYYLNGELREKNLGEKYVPDYTDIFMSNKSKSWLNVIFIGRKIDRQMFFSNAMRIYNQQRTQGHKNIFPIHRVYNFLAACGCLEGGWKMVSDGKPIQYESTEVFFKENAEYFNTNAKQAWFLLGRVYNTMSYMYRKSRAVRDFPLDKNFIRGCRFDFEGFINITARCWDMAKVYGCQGLIRNDLTTARQLIVNDNSTLSLAEANFVFSWGEAQVIRSKKSNDGSENIEFDEPEEAEQEDEIEDDEEE